jgi:hypothetical protein
MSEQKQELSFYDDLIKVQSALESVGKSSLNPHFKNKYANLTDILSVVKPALNNNNFFLTQKVLIKDSNEVLKTEITHKSGQILESEAPLNVADRNNPQKYGSAITYMRRYSLTALLGIEEEDDDGQKATQQKVPVDRPLNPAEIATIQKMIDKVSEIDPDFSIVTMCEALKVKSLAEIKHSRFNNIVSRLTEKLTPEEPKEEPKTEEASNE